MKRLFLFLSLLTLLFVQTACSLFDTAKGDSIQNQQAILYPDQSYISILDTGDIRLVDKKTGNVLLTNMIKKPSNIALTPGLVDMFEEDRIELYINNIHTEIAIIYPKSRVVKFDGNNEGLYLLIAGSNWSNEYNAQKSIMIKDLIEFLKDQGDVYLLEYTVGSSISEKTEYFHRELMNLLGDRINNIDGVVAISQGSQVFNSMKKMGFEAKKEIAVVAPNNGIIKNFAGIRDILKSVDTYQSAQFLCPEGLDMLSGSSYYKNMEEYLKSLPDNEDYFTIGINTMATATDLLIPNMSTHKYTSEKNSITIYSKSLNHYNMDKGASRIIRKVVRDILSGNSSKQYIHTENGTGGSSRIINDMVFEQNEFGDYITRISDSIVTIDIESRRILFDRTPIASYESIDNTGKIIGMEAEVLLEAPDSFKNMVSERFPGLTLISLTLKLENNGIEGAIALKYDKDNLQGAFIGKIRYDKNGLLIDISSNAKLVSYYDTMIIVWKVGSFNLRSNNGKVNGELIITGATRFDVDISDNEFSKMYEGTMEGLISGGLASLVINQMELTKGLTGLGNIVAGSGLNFLFSPILNELLLKNNIGVEGEAEIELGGKLHLTLVNGIIKIDAEANAEIDIDIALTLFDVSLPVGVKGDVDGSAKLQSEDLSQYLEVELNIDADGNAHVLFIPIASGSLDADATLRMNFTKKNPKSYVNMDYRFEGAFTILTIISEEGDLKIVQIDNNNYHLEIEREYWDVARDITIKGYVDFHVQDKTEEVIITKHSLKATGRAATVFGANSKYVTPIAGKRSIKIPYTKLKAWSEGKISMPCGKWRLWKVLMGETWMDEMKLAW